MDLAEFSWVASIFGVDQFRPYQKPIEEKKFLTTCPTEYFIADAAERLEVSTSI